MKSAQTSVKRDAMAQVTSLVATGTLVIAGGWCMLMLLSTAIGSKAPTVMELLAIMWPAVIGSIFAIGAFVTLSRWKPVVPLVMAVAGLISTTAGLELIVW